MLGKMEIKKFKCLDSCGGKCCTGKWDGVASFVFLTFEDRERLKARLGRHILEFARLGIFDNTRFAREKTVQWYLRDSENQCRFLVGGKCSVYEDRPTQCRTFPFWPENVDPKSWKRISEVCPGIDQGEEVKDAKKIMTEQIKADVELCHHKK